MWYLAIMPGRLPTLFRWVEASSLHKFMPAHWRNHNDDRIHGDPRDAGYTLYPVTMPKDGKPAAIGEALK